MTVPGNLSSPLLAVAAAGAAAPNITKSVRFNSADAAHLNRTPSSAGSNTTWTLSTWVKKTGNDNHIFGAGAGNTPGRFGFGFNGSDKIFALVVASGSTVFQITTDAVFRDPSAWYHIVLIADTANSTQADRFKIYVNGVLQSVSGTLMPSSQNTFVNTTAAHVIGRRSYNTSDPFNGYLADFYLIDGTAKDETDFGAFDANGVWQATTYSGTFGTNGFHLFDFANEGTVGHDSSGNENDFTANNISQASLTTWSNGWSNNLLDGFPATNSFNGTGTGLTIGGSNVKSTWTAPSSIPFTTLSIRGGHDQAVIKVNGTDVTSQFSSGLSVVTITGISSPLTSIDLDNTSGNGNARISAIRIDGELLADATPYPGAGNDVLFDVPVNGDQSDTGAGGEVSGNYCTLNPLTTTGGNSGTSSAVLSNGNLTTTNPSTAGFNTETGTIVVQSGKWYYEFVAGVSGSNILAGWCDPREVNYNDAVGNTGRSYGYYSTGNVRNSNSNTGFGSSYGAGDVIGCAIDIDNQKIYWSKNGTWQNSADPAAGTGSIYTIQDPVANNFFYTIGVTTYASGQTIDINTGQRAFAYTAPSGFKALCTTNLPTPTIADGSDYFNAITYTGDGVNDRTITTTLTTVGAAWIKRRNATDNHRIGTVVQGGNAFLSPNLTGAENNATSVIRAFSTNTFDLGTDTSVNSSSDTYVAWAWDAGTSNADNTDGSIATTVRANIAAGFSIVTYSGTDTGSSQTLGHGLGVAPKFWIFKNRSVASDWIVYTTAIDGSTDFAKLNTSDPFASGVSPWSTAPTSSVITVGTNNVDTCNAGNNYILYAFTPVEGYSAIGSYAGNGSSTDGPFIHTGFRSRWILIKRTDGGTNNWVLHDTARDQHNEVTKQLLPSTSAAETDTGVTGKDILSNGFKIRGDNDAVNKSGGSYIYIAFAENPFQANGGLAR